ncbi:hypothetical protein ACPOL_2091 [Acidisarcina polymorpha]|uniref:DUF2085 domain-containing protein n=1 Tax=Acidisarcina polymorpha TaxID=2211140 RepID=A0A2Z5FX50_9BACT|nr:DUF2085 domain-containing protein [Acidisarcina polymorpha]AXC11421.1 hypothetical protein ACPOL_2091 [Acidisarcina polymorpha]
MSARWVIFFAASALVALAIAAAWPWAGGTGVLRLAIFAFFSKLCHQHADRSFSFFGARMAVCVRCLGIYSGTAVGSLLRLKYGVAIRALAWGLAANCADVAAESLGLHGNLPLPRLLIGAGFGVAVGAMLSAERDAERSTVLA